MKKVSLLCLGLVLISNFTFSQFKLEIKIIEIRNDDGNIMLQLFDENKKVLIQDMSPVKEKIRYERE
jgi:hypothetical protein